MPWPLIKLLPKQTHFKFVRLAYLAAFLSVGLVIASFVSMVTAVSAKIRSRFIRRRKARPPTVSA